MAAFPPPVLNVVVPELLRGLFRLCETECVSGCCGIDAFDISAEHLVAAFAKTTPAEWVARQNQFESLLNTISRHRGSVSADENSGVFNQIWPTPHDALNYFADWRREIALAVSCQPGFFDPLWRSADVLDLRDAIAAKRAFDRLPILADALEEAGCDNSHILTHLREPADHAHHCWVIDLLKCEAEPPRPTA